MKVLSTTGLTKLIELIKSAFISVDDVETTTEIDTVTTSEITLATVAISGDYDDLINKPVSRNIGEIIQSTIPLSDAGLHLLDGALIQGSGSYADFVTYIAGLVSDYPDLFETEANWQTSVTNFGVCGKFVYDSVNNTVRLPKITGIIEGTTDVNALGDLVEAGLPNITGSFDRPNAYGVGPVNGAFSKGSSVGGYSRATTSTDSSYVIFDASSSNSIYGNSSTVQPQAIKVLYYIVIATSTKTDIQVDIDEIATDLNSKADVDLTNVNNTGTSTGAGWAMPSGAYDTLTVLTSGNSYTAPANGYFFAGAAFVNPSDFIQLSCGGIATTATPGTSGYAHAYIYIPSKKGDSATFYYVGTNLMLRFVYAEGELNV